MKKLFILVVLFGLLPLLGMGCLKKIQTTQITKPVVPSGWQTLTNEQYGIQAIVPSSLTYYGCTQPVTLGVVTGSFLLGALWTPCLQIPGVPTGTVNGVPAGSNEVFDDTFTGYDFFIAQNIHSAEEAKAAVEKRWDGNCTLSIKNWSANDWQIVAGKEPPNAWTPTACSLLDNKPPIKGFYNPKTKTFVYWVQETNSFPIGQNQYADEQIQIFPTE